MSFENKQTKPDAGPMGMMKNMMGDGGPPMEMCMKMCTQMSQSIERASEMAAYATPEFRGLFDSWLEEVEKEALGFITEIGSVSVAALAEKLGISDESSIFILSKLARAGKLDVSAQAKSR